MKQVLIDVAVATTAVVIIITGLVWGALLWAGVM